MPNVRVRLATLLLLVLGVFALPGAASAVGDVDDFTFSSLDVEYTLGRADDGTSTLRVQETFTAQFPETDQNRGMRRSLPDTFKGQPLYPELISVTDGSGAPRNADVEHDDGVFQITSAADGYVHGTQVYVFTYTVRNVTWDYPDTGLEFFWDVQGVDWAQPFGSTTATIRVDPELADAMTGDMACYAGPARSTATCPIDRTDGATVIARTGQLGPNQTMSFAIGFTPGTFALYDTSFFSSPWGWVQVTGVALGVGALVWAIIVRRRRLRDEPGRPVIIAEYAPPPGMDALESAVLLGKQSKAIPAEVLEQAVVGSIRIVEAPRSAWGKTKLQALLVDPTRADGDGRVLLTGLFGEGAAAGAVYEFGANDTRMSSTAQKLLTFARKEIGKRALRRTVPARVRLLPLLLAFAALALTILGGVLALVSYVDVPLPILLILGVVPVFVLALLVLTKRPLTAAGAEIRDHLKGLQVFIAWAEEDRIRMLQSPEGAERRPIDVDDPRQMLHLYEALLPYAVVFGQEKEWAQRLAVFYEQSGGNPIWYAGTAGFSAAAFSSGISSLSSSAISSSSTGGSTGGGSAGGGGGGGGGGGV